LTYEDGVSPVVGVILVIAITVVLSGVVGVFAFDLGDSLSTGETQTDASVRIDRIDAGSVTVTLITDADNGGVSVNAPETATVSSPTLSTVGDSVTISGLQTGDSVTVTSDDGSALVQSYSYSPSGSSASTSMDSSGTVTGVIQE
jgi:flagellin-like protein